MKVRDIINMLEEHNLNADVKIVVGENKPIFMIGSEASCKCKEKEITIYIGK